MLYWRTTSGRWANLISCHQGLKTCSGSSSKERVFLEGCPDAPSLLYYLPYSSASWSNYSDKSLKELPALPGKQPPQVSCLSPSSWTALLLELIIRTLTTTVWMATTPEKLSLFLTPPLLSAEEVSYAFLMVAALFQIILQLLYLDGYTLTSASCHGFLPQILEVGIDRILTNYWLPIEILQQRSQTGHILLPEALYLVHLIGLKKKKASTIPLLFLCMF